MPEGNTVMGLAAAFIGIAIMLGVGVQILGNATTDCSGLVGFDTNRTSANDTEWAATCLSAQDDTRTAYNLLLVALIVVAAVAILFIVRML